LSAAALATLGLCAVAPDASAVTFQEVCAQSTTVNCFGFESESEMYYTWQGSGDSFLQSHPNGNNPFGLTRQSLGNTIANTENAAGVYVYPKRDSTLSEFPGGTSLKFTMLSQSGQKTSGDFTPVFKQIRQSDGSYRFGRFGPGGEFWVRFAMYQSPELITTQLRDEGGGGFGGVKRLIIHGVESSSDLEETINDGFERRVPQMYSNSGTEDYGVQDFIGCTRRNPDVASSYTEPPCRKFKANQWVVYQVHVIVANNSNRSNGIVELYLEDEPTPIIRVTNADMWSASGAPYSEDTEWDSGDGYGKLSFTLFSTRKDMSQVHPPAYMWIDNVVVSKTRVPRLTASSSGDTLAPAAPGNLRSP
jgi:hypothetical protein